MKKAATKSRVHREVESRDSIMVIEEYDTRGETEGHCD